MRRRELLKAAAAAVVPGVGYASNARAQSKPKMQKEPTIAGLDVNTTTISVEHVTIPSQKPFESVKAALERLVPRIDDGIFVLLPYGEAERAHRELEQAPNSPLTASRMTEHQLSAALYAPIRVLLRENMRG
jgi:hypothetical protein